MKTAKSKDSATSRWLSYRPEIRVLDCTIRDGGLINDHCFDDALLVTAVYQTCIDAGIDYMESVTGPRAKASKPGDRRLEILNEERSAASLATTRRI